MEEKWPFIPQHISNDRRDDGLTGIGIIPNAQLQGYQTIITANVGNPTAIVEFSPDDPKLSIKTNWCVKAIRQHQPCSLFREFTDAKYCDLCDGEHALLLSHLRRDDVADEVKLRISTMTCGSTRPVPDSVVNDKTGVKRCYVEYDCPLMGYRELASPIFVEDSVVAVILVGEICLKGKRGQVDNIRESFFGSEPDCFKTYCSTNRTTPEDCQAEIRSANNKAWRRYEMDDTAYGELIGQFDAHITEFEKALEERVANKREQYALQSIDQEISELYKNLPRKVSIEHGRFLGSLWKHLEDRLNTLADMFEFDWIALFGNSNSFDSPASRLPMVASTPDRLPTCLRGGEYDAGLVPQEAQRISVTSAKYPELLLGLPGDSGKDASTSTVLTHPIPFHGNMPFVIAVGHRPELGPTRFPSLLKSLTTFNNVVVSVFASMLEALAEERTRASYRIFGHETIQLTEGLEGVVAAYLSDGASLKNLQEKKADDICKDVMALIENLEQLFGNATSLLNILSEPLKVNKTSFQAYGELLGKWKDFYRMELRLKGLEMLMDYAHPLIHPEVYADKELLERLLYNLINNAVKYAYPGTRIYVNCRKGLISGRHHLTVTNFGPEMPAGEPGERLYGLFERSDTIVTEGLGIGLFLARKIAQAHRDDLTHECRMLSKFNVPLIGPYLKSSLMPMGEGRKELEDEVDRLKARKCYQRIIAIPENGPYRPGIQELRRSIGKPTYEVTFTATIPAREDA